MNTSLCNHDESYELHDTTVPIQKVFDLIAQFIAKTPNVTPIRVYNAHAQLYLIDKLRGVLETRTITSGDGELQIVPKQWIYDIVLTDTVRTQSERYYFQELYLHERDIFDNLVKCIRHQSPELVQEIIVAYRQQ